MVVDCKTVRIFAYSSTREQSNKRSRTRLKTEGERLARFAVKTLTPRFTDFLTDFEKKTDCFAVYKRGVGAGPGVGFGLGLGLE